MRTDKLMRIGQDERRGRRARTRALARVAERLTRAQHGGFDLAWVDVWVSRWWWEMNRTAGAAMPEAWLAEVRRRTRQLVRERVERRARAGWAARPRW